MKRKFLKSILCLILSMCLLIPFGCKDDGSQGGTPPDEPSYELTLDKTEVYLTKGATISLTASEGAESYFWHAEDPYLVRVVSKDNTCEIASRGDGVTKIIVKADGQESECIVHASIDNFDRVSSILYYCESNVDSLMKKAYVSQSDTGVSTLMAFEEGSVVIAEITLLPNLTFTPGTLNSITIKVSFNINSTTPIARQILNSANISVIYFYPGPKEGLSASGSYKLSNLVYTIDSQNNVDVSDGTMTNVSNLNSIGSYYKGLIVNATLDLLNEGMTDFINEINEKCHIDICK